ncbi:MAG: inositol monophosphatase family protein, partial [Candidatus Zixiibacteriota bacterium]
AVQIPTPRFPSRHSRDPHCQLTMTQRELRDVVSFGSKVAVEAGRILKKGISGKIKVKFKGKINPVTEFDLKAERYIVSRIKKKYPHHSIQAEEGQGDKIASEYCWVIDPLDGTVNYSHNFPIYAVSIALCIKGEPMAGFVCDPERDELFWAAKRQGAYLNKNRIIVSNESRLVRSLLSTGFAYNIQTARKNNLGMYARMSKKAQAVRRSGSAALDLSWVACGRLDGYWEYYLAPWDTAAGVLIVTEAGGEISCINGKKYSIFRNDILASNGKIHHQIRAVLNGNRKR